MYDLTGWGVPAQVCNLDPSPSLWSVPPSGSGFTRDTSRITVFEVQDSSGSLGRKNSGFFLHRLTWVALVSAPCSLVEIECGAMVAGRKLGKSCPLLLL